MTQPAFFLHIGMLKISKMRDRASEGGQPQPQGSQEYLSQCLKVIVLNNRHPCSRDDLFTRKNIVQSPPAATRQQQVKCPYQHRPVGAAFMREAPEAVSFQFPHMKYPPVMA